MLERIKAGQGRLKDLDLLLEIGDSIGIIPGTTICGLADGAAWPIKNAIRKFRGEFEDYIKRTNPDRLHGDRAGAGIAGAGDPLTLRRAHCTESQHCALRAIHGHRHRRRTRNRDRRRRTAERHSGRRAGRRRDSALLLASRA